MSHQNCHYQVKSRDIEIYECLNTFPGSAKNTGIENVKGKIGIIFNKRHRATLIRKHDH